MKWLPLVCLMFLMSCIDTPRRYGDSVVPVTRPAPSTQESQLRDLGPFTSRATAHLNPKVKIDTLRQEIEIIDHSGRLCGIDFNTGDILRYQLLNNEELEVLMPNETLKLKRIHQNSNDVFGDWQEVKFTPGNSERIVTFFIRDNEIMYVDVYCERHDSEEF